MVLDITLDSSTNRGKQQSPSAGKWLIENTNLELFPRGNQSSQ